MKPNDLQQVLLPCFQRTIWVEILFIATRNIYHSSDFGPKSVSRIFSIRVWERVRAWKRSNTEEELPCDSSSTSPQNAWLGFRGFHDVPNRIEQTAVVRGNNSPQQCRPIMQWYRCKTPCTVLLHLSYLPMLLRSYLEIQYEYWRVPHYKQISLRLIGPSLQARRSALRTLQSPWLYCNGCTHVEWQGTSEQWSNGLTTEWLTWSILRK